MTDKFPRLYALSQQEIDVYLDMDQDLRDLFSQRDNLKADLAAAQAIIVDAGQRAADLKAENERLRGALESVNSVLVVHPEWNAAYDKQVDWLLEQEERVMAIIREALQPKEDKQS